MRILILFLFAFVLPCISHAQWVRTPDSTQAKCIATIGNSIFAGGDFGVARSDDNGASWVSCPRPEKGQNDAITFGVVGNILFSGTNSNGIFLSPDTGKSWIPANSGLSSFTSEVVAFATMGSNLFAAKGEVFQSTDSGEMWSEASNGLTDVFSLASLGTNLFAGTYNAGIFRSTDSGKSWVHCGGDFNDMISALAVKGTNVYVGTWQNVFRSSDSGSTWTASNSLLSDNRVQAIVVSDSGMFCGTSADSKAPGTVYRSNDNGVTWTAVGLGLPNTSVYGLTVDKGSLFAATSAGVFRRPLSEMIGSSAVEKPRVASQQNIQIYPNPSSQSTTISFSDEDREPAKVTILNLLGEEVQSIYSGELEAGEHSFTWDCRNAPAGSYFCVVRTGDHVERSAIMVVH